jgi:hypothetical protein
MKVPREVILVIISSSTSSAGDIKSSNMSYGTIVSDPQHHRPNPPFFLHTFFLHTSLRADAVMEVDADCSRLVVVCFRLRAPPRSAPSMSCSQSALPPRELHHNY